MKLKRQPLGIWKGEKREGEGRIRRSNGGSVYDRLWKCHNEIHYFIQLIYADNKIKLEEEAHDL
jgi:hypothetical protein